MAHPGSTIFHCLARARRGLAAIATLVCLFPAQGAGLIDFETVPGGSPADQLAITTQYLVDFGVRFELAGGGNPFLEAVGDADGTPAFYNQRLRQYDLPSAGFEGQLGSYFLRLGTDTFAAGSVPVLRIVYANPVAAASAQIWDIDGGIKGTEQWQLTALDAGGAVIDSLLSPLGTSSGPRSLNGKPWTWSFDHGATADISVIELSFVGSKASGIGLAFDNFSPTSAAPIPEPDRLALMLLGLPVLMAAVRRRRAV